MGSLVLCCFFIFYLTGKLSSQLSLTQQNKTRLTFQIEYEGELFIKVKGLESDFYYEEAINTAIRSNFTLDNLSPASIYEITLFKDETEIVKELFATVSNSSGEIKHYFNHPVLQGKPGDIEPDGVTYSECEKVIRDLFKSAKKTIDYCAYNSNVASIINGLIDAQNRGVRVRVIADNSTSNSGLNTSLPFQVLKDQDQGLMHNKFIIVDAADELNSKIATGSMNFTLTQMNSDPNHFVVIQDQSLAKTYEMEFEEMWGSKTEKPNFTNSKFSSNKTDNTPHIFTIGEVPIECYFSPSDFTSTKIKNKLKTANETIDLSLMIFTYQELANQLIDNVAAGVKVNGLIDDVSNSQSNVNAINAAGGNMVYEPSSKIYHYKMAIVDADYANSNPILITGSHNWTFSAETKNDENTLIFSDAKIANLYKRAMYYWWNQFVTSLPVLNTTDFSVINKLDHLEIDNLKNLYAYAFVFDNVGRQVIYQNLESGINSIETSKLNNGIYYLIINQNGSFNTFKFIKL